ncbi:MAG: 2-oxoacid:acceptor oxidoreductase family protein, partial [Planctomycetota bacterium]
MKKLDEYIIEIVSDSGEGAQKAGQALSAVSAKMGNGVWTVEIIPAEIQPPARSPQGASGIRVRIGSDHVTNMGDEADLVMAFNEQVLYGRIKQGAYKPGTVVLVDNKWASDPSEEIQQEYATTLAEFRERGFVIYELPMDEVCLQVMKGRRRGKNMFVLGMLCEICSRDLDKALEEVALIFKRKGEEVIESNRTLVREGYAFAKENIDFQVDIPRKPGDEPLVVMNGNQAIGLGVMASGMDVVAMYPITPATSASHYLAEAFSKVGGILH